MERILATGAAEAAETQKVDSSIKKDVIFQGINTQSVAAGDEQIRALFNTAYFWSGAIAVVIIVLAGAMYASSAGNPDQAKKAKNAIINAIIGLIIVLLAFAITNFVLGNI